MKKVYYINHLGDYEHNRNNAMSGDSKISYIIDVLKKTKYDVEVLSFCEVRDMKYIFKKYPGYEREYNGVKIKYFTCYSSKYKIIRGINHILTWIKQKRYLKNNCINDDCSIVIYHSLSFLKLYKFLHRKKKNFIIEVEEIYSDVLKNIKKRKKEMKCFQMANKYIFVTELLNQEINVKAKPYIISHGVYKVENKNKRIDLDKNKIHCVYAGTFNPEKGGTVSAAVAQFLPDNYHIHILGFTSPKRAEDMRRFVCEIQKKSKATITYDGLLRGNDYIKFMQSCDIGLSTQNPNASFNATSFPSKILSYMANGLRVVSIRLHAIETSKVGKYIYYYDKQDPEIIAKTIMGINLNDDYDSRKIIQKLDEEFRNDFVSLIEN